MMDTIDLVEYLLLAVIGIGALAMLISLVI